MRYIGAGLLSLLLTAFAFDEAPITVHLAGDSTMAEKLVEKRPETGWGEHLQAFFHPGRVRVENHARNGRSTRTFIEEERWSAIVAALKPGDYVFVQFGHNDASPDKPDRYTPPGEFRDNLVRFISETKAGGATPVLLTPVMRRRFDAQGAFYDAHGEYPDIVRAVAAEHGVPLIDMHRLSERVIRDHGVEGSKALFLHLRPNEHANYPDGLVDDTHFSPRGAEIMAGLAADGIRAHVPGLAAHMKDRVGVGK